MTKFLAVLALLFATPAAAQQVPAPINAPKSVTSGHALCATANPQQAADCGTAPGTITNVTASAPLSSSGGTTPNLTIVNPLPPANGGTGIANAGGTLTLGGAVVFAGANAVTFTSTGTTDATLPSGTKTLADLSDAQTFSATQTFSNATHAALFTGGPVGIGNISPAATLDVTGGIRAAITTVLSLPTCSSANEGERRGVSDATAMSFSSTVAGGGGNHVPVYCNGTNWIVG